MRKYTTVIEITTFWLKLAAVKTTFKGPEVISLVAKPIASLSPEEVNQELREQIKKLKFIPSPLILSFPRNLVTMRNLHLPSRNPKEINGMIELHISKQVPYPKEEIVGDYQILGLDEAGFSKVILAIVHRQVLRRIFDILNNIGLFPEKVELSSQGVLSWFLFNQKEHLDPSQIYALLDIDSNFTDFMIVGKNNLLFSRSIACGSEQIFNEEIRKTKFISELKQSLVIFQSEEINKKPTKVFISGSIDVSGLDKFLEKELNSAVEMIKLPKGLPAEVPREISVSAVLGLASEPSRKRINFILPEIGIRKALKERSKELLFLGSLLMFVLVISCGIFLGKMHNRSVYLKLLNKRFGEIGRSIEELDTMQKKIKIIEDCLSARILSLDYLYQIHRFTPKEITLKMITFEADSKITLRGQALAMSDVFKFITTLEDSGYFKDIQTKYTTKKRTTDKDISEFEIVCPISKVKK